MGDGIMSSLGKDRMLYILTPNSNGGNVAAKRFEYERISPKPGPPPPMDESSRIR